jgi:probable F420-dependent oxidoreductase
MTDTSLRIAVGASPDRLGGIEQFLKVARRADHLGFHYLGFPDHIVMPSTPGRDPIQVTWYDIFGLAAAAAMVTSNIRFVFTALVIPYRHPVELAKRISTLDQISNGRLSIVCGTGWMRREFTILGVPHEERGPRTDDAMRAMKTLWTGALPEYHGDFYSFSPVNFEPKCVQKPHVPLWVGGSGRRPLQRAIELGDGWLPMTGTLVEIAESIKTLKDGLDVAGRDPEAFTFGFGLQVGEPDATSRAMSSHVAHGRPLSDVEAASPGQALDVLGRMRSVGINHVGLRFNWRTPNEYEDKLQEFAEEILANL